MINVISLAYMWPIEISLNEGIDMIEMFCDLGNTINIIYVVYDNFL